MATLEELSDMANWPQVPHCDQRVLHAPGECKYCDDRPEWQQARIIWGVAFSGHDPEPDQVRCPSEAVRPRETINMWYGNVPHPEGEGNG